MGVLRQTKFVDKNDGGLKIAQISRQKIIQILRHVNDQSIESNGILGEVKIVNKN